MLDFIFNVIFCTLAIYGLIEIIKNVYYTFTYANLKPDGIYIIVAVKNQEEHIEGFLRNFLFRVIYGKEEMIKQILVADLGSEDNTKEIIDKIGCDYCQIKSVNWKDCKEIIENING
ncbi:MAG: hypothetical protein IKP28_00650 [Clostridia bacterium]|nr:hypothetical protein [Clostridia bacterium]